MGTKRARIKATPVTRSRNRYYQEWRRRNHQHCADYLREYRRCHPGIVRAHRAVANALKTGALVRPGWCQDCGATGKLEAHHDDYSRPLDVDFLCVKCHREVHRENHTAVSAVA